MRAQLSQRRRHEEGAVAVMVAILSVVLFTIAAFVADLGVAYTSKRQLQTAADAGALAGAKRFAGEPGSCPQLKAAFSDEAEAAAEAIATENRAAQVNEDFDVECLTTGPYEGALQVTYRASGDTPTYFSGGQDGEGITTEREASAVVFVPGSDLKLRPYGLCSLDVPPVSSMPTGVIEVKGPGQAHGGSGCPDVEGGGNWWFMSCPGTSSSGMNPHEVATAIRDGCANGAEVVTPQDATSPASLSSSLTAHCTAQSDVSPSCLDADTGGSSLSNPDPVSAWGDILGETIVVPVFCSIPTCSPTTVDGAGTGRVYPVFKLAAVVVCGYHMYDKGSDASADGDCAGNTFTDSYADLLGCSGANDACLPAWNADGTPAPNRKPKESMRLFLRFVQEVSGVTVVKCDLGDACDGGLRQIAMNR
ncbi:MULTISPECIES: pilus assembly protein TadG-related protein [Nocardioides]|uniref:pilus assembly protein TadG-related protein n=1 Tax=Nocardioides TaxID=1839 RepID=UPI00032E5E3D|nr:MULTISPECIES: pilus assembly protein TadG-related protein [Nocardioides]EON23332.1 TadE-like family protein [Nocardioides sp. CF8]